MKYENLTRKKEQLDSLRPLPPELVRNLNEWFRVELTYTSNAIEGNTLTRRETAVVLEKGITVGGKSLKEHLEATNHAQALDFVHSLIKKKPSELTTRDILTIHEIILRSIDDENAGRFRTIPVRISGAAVVLPNPRKVPDLMSDFLTWLTTRHALHPIAFAGEAHFRLVKIHPFVDGNGRTARLLMNLLLTMAGYPPAIIRKRDRLAYIGALEKAQLGGSKEPYERVIAKAAERSLDIYLQAAHGKVASLEPGLDHLLKIGALAKAASVAVSTIRHWTREGLLEVADVTESGYQLYSPQMVQRCSQIQRLQAERLTLDEIKRRLENPRKGSSLR